MQVLKLLEYYKSLFCVNDKKWNNSFRINPISPGLWNDVVTWGRVKKHRTTMDPSAVSEGQGQGSPKFLTLFLSISDMSQGSHFWNFYLKILENWTSKFLGGPRALAEKLKNRKKISFFSRNPTFSGWIIIVHVLSFLLRYVTLL